MPNISATETVFPSAAPISKASLTSPIPIPAGYASAAANRKPAAANAPIAHFGLCVNAVFAANTITAAGRTIRFGMILCSASIADTATSTQQKNAATAARAVSPNASTHPATSSAVTSSTAGYTSGIRTAQCRQRPRSTAYDTSGTLWYQRISCPHCMHADGGRMIDRFNGTRAATTFRNDPRASPGASATAARAKSTEGLSARTVPELRDALAGDVVRGRVGLRVDDRHARGADRDVVDHGERVREHFLADDLRPRDHRPFRL